MAKLLVLMPKEWAPFLRQTTLSNLEPVLSSKLGEGITLVETKAWYDQTYGSCGSWDGWIWETVLGKDYSTREPHFAGFVCAAERLDRTTATIASQALHHNRTVLAFNQSSKLLLVNRVDERYDEAGGWVLVGTPIEG